MAVQNNVLVINCGSSSLKFAVMDSESGAEALTGLAERLGNEGACITFKYDGKKLKHNLEQGNDHLAAIKRLVEELVALNLKDTVVAVGHRIVHGGEKFTQSVVIDNDVIEAIKEVSGLAPLHNPANLVGIAATQAEFPDLKQVAVFDTAFHQTMPKHAYLYGIDRDLYTEQGLRRYGFHGTSHYFVSREAAKLLNQTPEQTSVISVHLGNGCSVTAIENGESVDTSMGVTPVEGLVMGTRSGDVDPGLIIYLMREHGYDADQIDNLLNKQSGLLGLSKLSNDCRSLEEAVEGTDEDAESARLALDVFAYRVAKYVASYTTALSKLDAIIFTGGIGENSDYLRNIIVERLKLIGLEIDKEQNLDKRFGNCGEIQTANSNSKIFVIPTNEELVIAQDAARLAK